VRQAIVGIAVACWLQQQADADYVEQIRRNSWRGPGVKFMHLSYASGAGHPRRRQMPPHHHPSAQLQPDQNQKTNQLTGFAVEFTPVGSGIRSGIF
jgi:hypothetical protein